MRCASTLLTQDSTATLPSYFIHSQAGFATICRGSFGWAIFVFAATLWSPLAHTHELSGKPATLESILQEPRVPVTATVDQHWLNGAHRQDHPDARQVRQRTMGIIAANALGVGLYGRNNWWRDGFNGSFRSVNEGWFGQNTYAGGADKLGHLYANYAGTRLFARAFEWAGNTPDASLMLAAWLTLGTFTAVEVIDGFSSRWRFSKEDAVMNAIGVGAALLLEKNPELDRLLDLRLLYQPSYEQHRKIDPFGDYPGQTYLVVAKASGVPALRNHSLLRYFELAVGYGARGYSDDRSNGAGNRSRNFYVGISINLSELLAQTVFKHAESRSRAQRATDTVLEFVQVPGTAAFAKHKF